MGPFLVPLGARLAVLVVLLSCLRHVAAHNTAVYVSDAYTARLEGVGGLLQALCKKAVPEGWPAARLRLAAAQVQSTLDSKTMIAPTSTASSLPPLSSFFSRLWSAIRDKASSLAAQPTGSLAHGHTRQLLQTGTDMATSTSWLSGTNLKTLRVSTTDSSGGGLAQIHSRDFSSYADDAILSHILTNGLGDETFFSIPPVLSQQGPRDSTAPVVPSWSGFDASLQPEPRIVGGVQAATDR